MAKGSLVIVESPAKAKTISKILGPGFLVKASMGHVKDLPEDRFGVDIDKGFKPHYVVIPEKRKVLNEIKKAAKDADRIFLASDPDREGEAICWHIKEEIKGEGKEIFRVLFNEITEKAVKEAIRNPGQIDMRKVEAQQARRILDRIVGYQISPLLWGKVGDGLSAGRVQSVAVRLICEREREIEGFVPEEYWTITAVLETKEGERFEAKLLKIGSEKAEIKDGEEARRIAEELSGSDFRVASVSKKETKRNPSPPFTTSTMQQEAARRSKFSPKKTMAIAQQLYEGVDIGGGERTGLITYMRTDSVRVSEVAQMEARDLIRDRYGEEYLPDSPPKYKNKGGAIQDAHEAIRPTSVKRVPEDLERFLTKDQLSLYSLIWSRFVASQMRPAIFERTTVDVEAGRFLLRASGSIPKFLGFMAVYVESKEEEEEEEGRRIPDLSVGEELSLVEILPEQHFTQPPPRYNDATLVKALEEKGIGRPSTYAQIISTIEARGYVERRDGVFYPTKLGMLVNDLLVEHFPRIMDVGFTAQVEERLDKVEEGEEKGIDLLKEFYDWFSEELKEASAKMRNVRREGVETEERCELCGRPMVMKIGRYGKFLACSGFPDCKNTRRYEEGKGRCVVPGCDGFLVKRRSKKGKVFYGCSRYPKCGFVTSLSPLAGPCPSCGAPTLFSLGKGKVKCLREGCGYIGRKGGSR
jgi:DNA topoisomerase-1